MAGTQQARAARTAEQQRAMRAHRKRMARARRKAALSHGGGLTRRLVGIAALVGAGVLLVGVVLAGLWRDDPTELQAILTYAMIFGGGALMIAGWVVWIAVGKVVGDDGRWRFGDTPRERLFRIGEAAGIGLIGLGVLGLFAGVLLAGWLTYTEAVTLEGAIGIGLMPMLIPIALGILGSATVGAVVLGGAKAAWIGPVFTFGMGAVVAGFALPDQIWLTFGFAGLAVATSGFYALGARHGALPPVYARLFGSAWSVIVGGSIAALGLLGGFHVVTLIGVLAVASFIGMRVGSGFDRRSAA